MAYICVCFAITDEKIKSLILDGHNTFKKICKKTKVGSGCGICKNTIDSICKDENNRKNG